MKSLKNSMKFDFYKKARYGFLKYSLTIHKPKENQKRIESSYETKISCFSKFLHK